QKRKSFDPIVLPRGELRYPSGTFIGENIQIRTERPFSPAKPGIRAPIGRLAHSAGPHPMNIIAQPAQLAAGLVAKQMPTLRLGTTGEVDRKRVVMLPALPSKLEQVVEMFFTHGELASSVPILTAPPFQALGVFSFLSPVSRPPVGQIASLP